MPPLPLLLHLVLLDDDPTYRAGVRLWLEQFSDMRVVADGGLGLGMEAIAPALSLTPSPETAIQTAPLIIVGLPGSAHGFSLCQQLRTQFPQVPILVLGTSAEPVVIAATRRVGASGFWLRNGSPDALATTIRRVATGQSVWVGVPPDTTAPPTVPGPLRGLRRNWRVLGIQQIERAIADLDQQLCDRRLSSLDRLVLEGRRRELNAARWLVKRMLATPTLPEEEPTGDAREQPPTPPVVPQTAPISALATVPVTTLETRISAQSLRSLLINEVLRKFQSSVANLTQTPMETDILRADRKQELFMLILRKLEDMLDELRFSQVTMEQLPEKRSQLLRDLWETTITDFFGKYYTVATPQGELELVTELLDEANAVQVEILNPIPGFETLITHVLFQTPLIIDGVSYSAGNPEALIRAEMLLSHLVIQVANGVMQPLLNRFSDLEVIKQNFYDRRLISTRDVERFRNDLSWHYRRNRYFAEPRDIFESRYRLLTFQLSGIQYRSIYAPRRAELDQLNGIPYVVTLALETRDAIAPRLRSVFSVVGSSLVYVLTEVIGRGIGLVGRGVIKGVGNVWQDQRYSRNGERPR